MVDEPDQGDQLRIRDHCAFQWTMDPGSGLRLIEVSEVHCDPCIDDLSRQVSRAQILDRRSTASPAPAPDPEPVVLLVEDDRDTRDVLCQVLKDEGFSVVTASNGREALDYLISRQAEPFAVVLDLEMPVMSGAQFLRVMRSYLRLSRIPVVISSGSDLDSHAEPIEIYAGHLKKPYDPLRLTELLHRLKRPAG